MAPAVVAVTRLEAGVRADGAEGVGMSSEGWVVRLETVLILADISGWFGRCRALQQGDFVFDFNTLLSVICIINTRLTHPCFS